jgi:mannose-6-phosphate isomerase-like protein (cupin superfamily)
MASTVTQFGPVVNEISGMGETHELLGGIGTCRWKQLINGMHLNGPWNCVEYVVIPPGASCGRHTHLRTEEIYYILAGTAEMDLNGEVVTLEAGDLVTAPIGTSHGTVNESDESMEFFVVEVFPGPGEAPAPRRVSVSDPSETDAVDVAEVPGAIVHSLGLADLFRGPWRRFELIDVAPGARFAPKVVSDGDEVVFIARGAARIEFGGCIVDGERGLCVGIPPDESRVVINRSPTDPLTVLSTVVGLD